mmetsp:Transcript_20714/g.40508  ORF Transcript_20714/g.40508 Transcript_20714/m.40508 type:complete len:203 (-) Transcript_20714:927-1535(-)
MATCAACASLIVFLFPSSSFSRNFVAFFMVVSSNAIALLSSATSLANLAIEASNRSISAFNDSTASDFSCRVAAFLVNSVSHQPLRSASLPSSSMSFDRRSRNIFLTLPNLSTEAKFAAASNTRLLRARAWSCRYSDTSTCPGLLRPECIAANTVAVACVCCLTCEVSSKETETFVTASPEMMLMAFLMASSSSARSACRAL